MVGADGGEDRRCFSDENLFAQLATAPYRNGAYELEFYADPQSRPCPRPSDRIARFYLSPSGGTLRDEDFHIVFYDSRFDTYRGFTHPTRQGTNDAGSSF